MSSGAFTLASAPLLPWLAIASLGTACLLILGFGILRRARGLLWRSIACAILLAALVNPSVVEEQRAPQREMAMRFGVNLVMYVLTGNYKSDLVHVPAILERLGQ